MIGFPALLTLLFIGLKLTDHVTWSWVWVLAPTWIPVVLLVLAVIAGGAAAWHEERRMKSWRRRKGL